METRWMQRRNAEGINETFYPITHANAVVGFENVENTADLDKPISNATQAALDTLNETTTGIRTDLTTLADSCDLVVTELQETITGEVPDMDVVIENRFIELENDVAANTTAIETNTADIVSAMSKITTNTNNIANIANVIYPVGSVYVSSTNTNPSSSFGGTWSLIDKEYKPQRVTAITTLTNCSAATVYAYLSGHQIDLYINITPSVAITDTTVSLLTIDPASCGATQFSNLTRYYTSFSDVSNVVITYGLTTAGVLSTRDVIVRDSSTANLDIPDQALNNFQAIVSLDSISYMLDSFCDKFYWKRTA